MPQYNQWIFDSFKFYLGNKIFEAGCGNGNITRLIFQTNRMDRYLGVDISKDFCNQLQNTLVPPLHTEARFVAMDLENPDLAILGTDLFDSIICLNVLEHIQEDQKLLKLFFSKLSPGGRLILQVPAFPALFGTIDEIDGHHRRYSRNGLGDLLRNGGFSVQQLRFFNFAGIPAWIWHGKIKRLKTHSMAEVKMWDKFVPILRWMEKWLPIPVGLSIFAVAEKPLQKD